MNFGQSSPFGVALEVWSSATRKLTSLQPALVLVGVQNQTLAASTSVDIQPTASGVNLSIGIKAGAAGSTTVNLFDGTNVYGLISVAAATSGVVPAFVITPNVCAIRLANNDAVNAAKYTYDGYLLT